MVELNTLFRNHVKRKKRVGRGIGSGRGKTSCRGVKGQKSRTGVSLNGFEGGQQSIVTSLPKRGFKSVCKVKPKCFNLLDFQRLCVANRIQSGSVIDNELLLSLNLIDSLSQKVKILGEGTVDVALCFKVSAFSKKAKEVIEQNGGSIQEC